MKESMVILEIALKQQLLAQRLDGHQGRPLSIAMMMTSVHHLCQLGEPEAEIRAFFERVLAMYKGKKVIMPSPNEMKQFSGDEIVKALGQMHDQKKEKTGQKPDLCEHGNLRSSCNIGACRGR